MAQISIIAGINKGGFTFIPNATLSGSTVQLDKPNSLGDKRFTTGDFSLRGTARVMYGGPTGGNTIYHPDFDRWIEIYALPKNKAQSSVGFFNSAPDPTNADSVPNTSWWDTQWSCQDWITWHKANITKYSQQTANEKFVTYALGQLNSLTSDHFCPYESGFTAYFKSQGINFDNPIASLYVNANNIITALGQGAENLGTTAMDLTALIKMIAPFAFFGAGVWAIDKFVYPIFPKRAAVSGYRKRRKKK